MQENIDLLTNIVRSIVNNDGFLEDAPEFNWREFSTVVEMDEDGDIGANYGYAYNASSEYCAFAVSPFEIEEVVTQYRDWLAKDTGEGFKKMLLQFNRDSGRVQADFEYDNPMRWKVTPNNIDQMIEDLRPNLGG